MNTRLFKGDHPQVADALATLGETLTRVGQPERGTAYLRQSDEMRKALSQKPAMKP